MRMRGEKWLRMMKRMLRRTCCFSKSDLRMGSTHLRSLREILKKMKSMICILMISRMLAWVKMGIWGLRGHSWMGIWCW